jgi:Tol biopolymer transport system component
MRAAVFAALALLSIVVPATRAGTGAERAPSLTFKVVSMTGEKRVLSRHAIDPNQYSLSPDHRHLAYVAQPEVGAPLPPVMIAEVLSPGESVLADNRFGDPTWAPNGHQIALQGMTRQSGAGLFFVNPDGGNLRYVAKTGAIVWSPDSKSLATRRPVSVFSLETGQERAFGQGNSPDWSPDGAQIAFNHNSDLFVASLGTGETRRVTRGWSPSWSPDGRRIAFIRYVGDAYHLNLWVVPVSGGTPRRLAAGLTRFAPFLWSPRGQRLAYVRGKTLFVRNLTGRNGRNLVYENGADIVPLAWSSDGRHLLYFTLRP